jgi:hypothetical protein
VTLDPEPLAVLLLPCRLEDFELASHARDLLAIPRVVALEPPRARPRRLRQNAVSALQARRLRFPGQPRLFVLYHAGQYPLARALLGVHREADLWYVQPDPGRLHAEAESESELIELDELVRARAPRLLVASPDGDVRAENEPLRSRLLELEIITHRPFLAGLRRPQHRRQFA